VPVTISGGSSTLASLTDCDINSTTPLQNSQILQYNSTLNKWTNTSSANQNLYYYQVYSGIEYWSPLGVQQNVTATNQPCHIYPFFTPTTNRSKYTNATTTIFDDTVSPYFIAIKQTGLYEIKASWC